MGMIRFLACCLLAALSGCTTLPAEYVNEKTGRYQGEPERSPAATSPASEEGDSEKEPAAQVVKSVAFVPFHNKTPYQDDQLSRAIETTVRAYFGKLPGFHLLPSEEFSSFSSAGEEEPQLGELLARARAQGISGIVTGTVEDVALTEGGDEVGIFQTRSYIIHATLRLRLLDAQTERELYSRTAGAEVVEEHTRFLGGRRLLSYDSERAKGAVIKAVEKAIAPMDGALKRMNWVGRIAKVELHRYYINSGELSGIRVGQLLKVFGPSAPIRDPQAGVFIGNAPGPFKGLLKVVDYFGRDGAVAVVHSGAGFRERDRVEIYTPPRD